MRCISRPRIDPATRTKGLFAAIVMDRSRLFAHDSSKPIACKREDNLYCKPSSLNEHETIHPNAVPLDPLDPLAFGDACLACLLILEHVRRVRDVQPRRPKNVMFRHVSIRVVTVLSDADDVLAIIQIRKFESLQYVTSKASLRDRLQVLKFRGRKEWDTSAERPKNQSATIGQRADISPCKSHFTKVIYELLECSRDICFHALRHGWSDRRGR